MKAVPDGVASALPWNASNTSPGLQEAKHKKAQRKIVNESEAHVFKEAVMVLVAENSAQQETIASLQERVKLSEVRRVSVLCMLAIDNPCSPATPRDHRCHGLQGASSQQSERIQYLVQKNSAQQDTLSRHRRVYASLASQRRYLLQAVIRGRGFKDEAFWRRFKAQHALMAQGGAVAGAGGAGGAASAAVLARSGSRLFPSTPSSGRPGTPSFAGRATSTLQAGSGGFDTGDVSDIGEMFSITASDEEEEAADAEGEQLLQRAVEWAEMQMDAVTKLNRQHLQLIAQRTSSSESSTRPSSRGSMRRKSSKKLVGGGDKEALDPLMVDVLTNEGAYITPSGVPRSQHLTCGVVWCATEIARQRRRLRAPTFLASGAAAVSRREAKQRQDRLLAVTKGAVGASMRANLATPDDAVPATDKSGAVAATANGGATHKASAASGGGGGGEPDVFDDQAAFQAVVAEELSGNFNMMFDLTIKMRHVLEVGEQLSLGHGGLANSLTLLETELRGTLAVRRASLFLHDDRGGGKGELVLQYGTGQPYFDVVTNTPAHDGQEDCIRFPANRGVAGWVFSHNKVAQVTDAYSDPRFNASVDAATGFLTRNILAAPVRGPTGAPVGVLEVLNKHRSVSEGFSIVDRVLLSMFASLIGLLVAHHKVRRLIDVCGCVAAWLCVCEAVAVAALGCVCVCTCLTWFLVWCSGWGDTARLASEHVASIRRHVRCDHQLPRPTVTPGDHTTATCSHGQRWRRNCACRHAQAGGGTTCHRRCAHVVWPPCSVLCARWR